MILLRESSFRAVPWKNGGGMTHEIRREPVQGTEFDWRLSLARIETSGPFSSFAGYHRTLVLVSGAGVDLSFSQHGRSRLTHVGQSVSFDGAWDTSCTLLDGPSRDLNLIVSQSRAQSQTRCLQVAQPESVPTEGWSEVLICCLQGSITVTNSGGETLELHDVDVARCSPVDGTLICHPLGTKVAQVFVAGVKRQQT